MGRLGGLPQFEIQTCESLLAGLPSGTPNAAFAGVTAVTAVTEFTQDECTRAQSIVSATRRAQFLAGRRLAKRMLSQALGGSPTDWPISADATAKPQVVGHDLQLSIAHSGPFVVCSIANQPVGIDIEQLTRARPVADMARLVCSDAEQRALQELHGDDASLLFLQWWTRKEARLKQYGLPFGFAALRAIETTAADPFDADVATWCFQEPRLVVSLAGAGLSGVHTCWPDTWHSNTLEWHRYSS